MALYYTPSPQAGHGAVFGETIYGTTILSVRKGNQVAVVGDGQVTQGSMVMKPNATKVRAITWRARRLLHPHASRHVGVGCAPGAEAW